MTKKLTPNVRFKGFSDDWEQRKLGDVVNVVGGGTPKSSNPQFWDGEIEWFTPTEIGITKYVSKSVRRISMDGLKHSSAKILPKNTILYTSRASIGDVAITKNEVTTNQGFQSWVPKDGETEFFYYLAQRIRRIALRLASGSTFKEISSSNIKGINVVIPSQKIEKQVIGKILCVLDTTIASNQKKVDQLKQLKKLFLQKIFSQEWRFKGFTDPWEQRKLSSIGKIITGSTPSTKKTSYYGGDYLFASPADIQRNRYISNTKTKLTELGFSKGRCVRTGATLFVCIGSTIGKVAQAPKDLMTNQQINSVIANEQFQSDYVYSLLEFVAPKIKRLAAIQAVPIINKNTFSNYEVDVSTYKAEQERIGLFLKKLDAAIASNQKKLDQLKQLKKWFLQNMFV